MASGVARLFTIAGQCGIPPSAEAVSFNVTVVASTGSGDITLYPSGPVVPNASTLSYSAGAVRASKAIVGLTNGILVVQPIVANEGQVHVVLDVNGYFD